MIKYLLMATIVMFCACSDITYRDETTGTEYVCPYGWYSDRDTVPVKECSYRTGRTVDECFTRQLETYCGVKND